MSVLRFDPYGDPFRQMDRLTNQLLSGTRTPMGMPMDVWQTEDGFHVCLDLVRFLGSYLAVNDFWFP